MAGAQPGEASTSPARQVEFAPVTPTAVQSSSSSESGQAGLNQNTPDNRVAVELGIKQGWEKYIGISGKFIGMCGYGTSAPLEVVLKHFGMTVENIVAAARESSIR